MVPAIGSFLKLDGVDSSCRAYLFIFYVQMFYVKRRFPCWFKCVDSPMDGWIQLRLFEDFLIIVCSIRVLKITTFKLHHLTMLPIIK